MQKCYLSGNFLLNEDRRKQKMAMWVDDKNQDGYVGGWQMFHLQIILSNFCLLSWIHPVGHAIYSNYKEDASLESTFVDVFTKWLPCLIRAISKYPFARRQTDEIDIVFYDAVFHFHLCLLCSSRWTHFPPKAFSCKHLPISVLRILCESVCRQVTLNKINMMLEAGIIILKYF